MLYETWLRVPIDSFPFWGMQTTLGSLNENKQDPEISVTAKKVVIKMPHPKFDLHKIWLHLVAVHVSVLNQCHFINTQVILAAHFRMGSLLIEKYSIAHPMCPSVTCLVLVFGWKGRSVKSYTAFLWLSKSYVICLFKMISVKVTDISATGDKWHRARIFTRNNNN